MQQSKIIDITRSYIPLDPRAYPNNLHGTAKQDFPETAAPVIPYEGWNFLPTDYGYKSYFGVDTQLAVAALTSKVDEVFIFQTQKYENVLIALCEDGIWIKQGEEVGAWLHAIILPIINTTEVYLEWSYAVLEGNLYVYRMNSLVYWKMLGGVSANILNALEAPTGLTATLVDGTLGIPDGSYEFAIAYKDENEWYSAPSDFIPITVTDTKPIKFTWQTVAGAVEYRLYRRIGSLVRYYTIPASSLGTETFWLFAAAASQAVDLPDISWLSNPDVNYQTFVPVEPTFLNMEGQLGIFSAGTRLGFWDSQNSIAWSSIDDMAEFTPSIQTLAGSAVFSAVSGRIVTIKPHGDGFIIYATKSIVWVKKDVSATFQWEPTVILNVGISYVKQVAVAYPNTKHYAYTHTGLYRIDEGREELLLVEVFDYLKENRAPVYLDILQGRYLIFQIMDEDFLLRQVQFQVDTIPPTTITFPQDTVIGDLGDPIYLTGNDACYMLQGVNAVHANAGASAVSSGGFTFSPLWRSLYRTHFSFGGVPPSIVWGAVPCPTLDVDGVELNFNPTGNRLTDVTQDSSNKYTVEDQPEDISYKMDSEKFVATQLALWRLADQAREQFIREVTSKSYTGTTTPSVDEDGSFPGHSIGYYNPDRYSCEGNTGITVDLCDIGELILAMSSPHWGISDCGLYLTRYVTRKGTLRRKTVTTLICEREFLSESEHAGWYEWSWTGSQVYNSPEEVIYAKDLSYAGEVVYTPTSAYAGNGYIKGPEGEDVQVSNPARYMPGRTTRYTRITHTLEIVDVQSGIFGVDTAYMEVAGWYNSANETQAVGAVANCMPPFQALQPPNSPSASIPISDIDGSICGIPFEPITLPAIQVDPILWPDQSVTYPPGAFLLQNGSIAPYYPNFFGALVYDIGLKKWGKFKQDYKVLLDYLPVNGQQGDNITFDTFLIKAGLVNSVGNLCLFNEAPIDSYLKYGKIGFHRQGFTECEEIRVEFKSFSSGQVEIEASLDGKTIEASLIRSELFTDAITARLHANISASWYNVTMRGLYDISHLEFRGNFRSRR